MERTLIPATRSLSDSNTETKITQIRSQHQITEEAALELLISCDGDVPRVMALLGPDAAELSATESKCTTSKSAYQATLKRFVDPQSNAFKKPRLDIKGRTVHVYDPEQVYSVVPSCTMRLGVFPHNLADELLEFLLKDSDSWSKNEFYMFDRQVASHHTSSFYTDNETVLKKGATYNGKTTKNMRPLNEAMRRSRDIIEDIVNSEIKYRGLAKYQYPGRWTCDVVLTNRYNGPNESVGYHSDQLTHIGPDCVIASVSLGVTREFRLKNKHDSSASTVSIHVPHNSLIIMHAGCQELYKHSIVPYSRHLDTHPIAGQNRINLTYRMYLPEFAADRIPKCECNYPMILRTTIAKNCGDYKYLWQCAGLYRSGHTCNKIVSPDFSSLYQDTPTQN